MVAYICIWGEDLDATPYMYLAFPKAKTIGEYSHQFIENESLVLVITSSLMAAEAVDHRFRGSGLLEPHEVIHMRTYCSQLI